MEIEPWRAAEEKLTVFCDIFKFQFEINDFRDYVDICLNESSNVIPENILKAKSIINTVAVSSAEVERSFSLMNNIATLKRANLKIEHIADLMTIKLLGQPFDSWNPELFVKSWLRSHHSAEDRRVRNPAAKETNDNLTSIWNNLCSK